MVVAMVANAAIPPTVQLGDEFTSVADLAGKSFAIVDKAAEKALYGSNNQNLAFDAYGSAFVTTNSGYTWQLESLAENEDESVHGYYLLHLVAPNGTPVPTSDWGGKYLNSQDKGGWCCFNLGIKAKKLGQDIDYGAVWDVQFVEGKGFSLKNIGTGLYKGADGGTANKEEAVYFAFVSVSITYVPALKALLAEGEAMKKMGASSAEYDAAIAGIDPDKSADALADAQKVEAALPALAKTQTAAGSDFTRAIANFDCGAKDGWTFEKPLGGNGPDHGGDFEYWAGNASNRAEASFDYWQEITGLPNGTYTVSAEMYNSLNNEGGNYTEFKPTVGVYATVGETTVSKLVDVNSETRVPYVTDEIEVTDGKIRIGAKSFEAPMAARWFTVDNFRLTLVKAAAVVPEKDAWFTGNTFCYKDAANNVSRSMELPWVADPADESNGCIALSSAANAGNDHDLQFMIRGAEYDGADLTKGAFAEGEGFKVTFKVKGDGNYAGCLVGSFISEEATGKKGWNFGSYLENQAVKMDVTTEWKTVSYMVRATSGDAAKLTAIGFNLADKGGVARTFYFDDVVIEKLEAKTDDWYYAIRVTDKWKEEGADKNKQADFNTEGGYVEIVTKSNANTYDNQVFFQIADAAPEGKLSKNDKVVLKFKAMAILDPESELDKEEIQAGGGFHKSYDGAGWMPISNQAGSVNIKIGAWTEIEKEITVLDDQVTNFSLDLSYDSKPITYRFDDVEATYTSGVDDWYLNNKVYAKDFSNGDESYENGTLFPAAPFKDGAVQVVSNANAENDYGSQIFFEIPEDLRGSEVELTMKVKASKEISVATALHSSADGNGWSGNPAGDKVDFKVGEWTEITRVLNTDCKDSKGNDIAYYVLNLSDNVGKEAVTYQFDDLSIKKYYAPVEWGDLVEVPVEGTLVTEKDWTKETSYSYWSVDMPEGCTRTIENGIVIENTKTDGDPWANQMFTLDGLTLAEGKEYVLRYTLKINGEGDLRADVGPWGTNLVKAPDTQTLENGYRQVVFGVGPCAQEYTGAHAIWQSRKFVGKIIIEKVELFDVTPKYDEMDWSENILKNGDLSTDDMSEFILKNNDVENPEMLLAEKNQYGEIGIETAALPAEGGNDYDAQFFVRLPYVLPKGTLFNLEFDLYAEHVNTLAIAAHGEPGEWKANISSVKTDPSLDAVHYQEYLTAPADMRSIAFNLAVADATTYGFSNIKVQIVNDDKATIEEATQTADATTLWAETLALNEACYAGRITETEGYTEESVKALTDAIAAGKAALAPADGDPAPTKESLTAAAKAITDAIAGLKKDAPALAYTDLTKEMFFHWNAADETAEALEASNCDYNIGTSTGQPYGLSTVNHDRFADLSAYNTIELTATEGEPRLLFNRIENEGTVFAEVPRDKDKYETVVDNGDGSKTYVIDIAAIVAEYGFAHLHAIKGANWANTTVTEIKLGYAGEKPALPIPTAIEGVETAEDALQDGKYFINGQIVIVKNGVKYNAAGVAIK